VSTTSAPSAQQPPPPGATPAPGTVTLTIDGQSVTVAKGTNVLEAARTLGIDISAFCYHPGLPIVAQCRQCLVSVEKSPKLQPSCQQVCADGMVVHTADPQSTLARQQQLEFTLLNHPVDCPICDKAGECTLQKLYFDHDNADSRVDVPKVHKAKAVDLGPTIVLDPERCILCSRCIRVCDEVSGEHQLEFAFRGDHEVLTTAPGAQLDNPYSLNTVDVCPVGALTS
jgi:NADH-quinone oxidoreductase subunit G